MFSSQYQNVLFSVNLNNVVEMQICGMCFECAECSEHEQTYCCNTYEQLKSRGDRCNQFLMQDVVVMTGIHW